MSALLRVLTTDDSDMLYRHYQELDPASKGCRFGVQLSDYALRSFIDKLDLNRDIHFAVVEDDNILALAQISRYSASEAHRLELGISVATNSRRMGFASLLWESVTQHVQTCNMHQIYVMHAPRNTAMASFCRNKGLHIRDELGERVGIWTSPSWQMMPENRVHLSAWPGQLPQSRPLMPVVPNLEMA